MILTTSPIYIILMDKLLHICTILDNEAMTEIASDSSPISLARFRWENRIKILSGQQLICIKMLSTIYGFK